MDEIDLWSIERECYSAGYRLICGADEAGAGPLAGPVYGAAVILPEGWTPKGLNDSKQVTPKNRDRLFDEIIDRAQAWAIVSADAAMVDALNILNARLLVMDRAIGALRPGANFALVDGNRDKWITLPHRTVIQGDSHSANIAAASILAKVSRDRYMEEMDRMYPQYHFARHKGYGTKLHYELLREHGLSPIHRKTFLKNL